MPLLSDDSQLLALMRAANQIGHPHVSEVYSPPRVTSLAHRFGLRPGMALNLTTIDENGVPWDLSFSERRERAKMKLTQEHRLLLV